MKLIYFKFLFCILYLNSNNGIELIFLQNYLNSLRILECLNYWNWFKFNLKEMGKCTVHIGLHLAGPNPAGLVAHCLKAGEPFSQVAPTLVASQYGGARRRGEAGSGRWAAQVWESIWWRRRRVAQRKRASHDGNARVEELDRGGMARWWRVAIDQL
jgi:hypothetical protein